MLSLTPKLALQYAIHTHSLPLVHSKAGKAASVHHRCDRAPIATLPCKSAGSSLDGQERKRQEHAGKGETRNTRTGVESWQRPCCCTHPDVLCTPSTALGTAKLTAAAQVLVGQPTYEVTEGAATFRGHDLLALRPEQRARLGLFMRQAREWAGLHGGIIQPAWLCSLTPRPTEPGWRGALGCSSTVQLPPCPLQLPELARCPRRGADRLPAGGHRAACCLLPPILSNLSTAQRKPSNLNPLLHPFQLAINSIRRACGQPDLDPFECFAYVASKVCST